MNKPPQPELPLGEPHSEPPAPAYPSLEGSNNNLFQNINNSEILIGCTIVRQASDGEGAEARALAEQLSKEARARGRLEGMQEATFALSQKDDQIAALTRTIEELRQGAASGTPGMEEALALLREGKFEAAEALFTKIGEAKAAVGMAANKEAAHAFRNIGNIASLYDTRKALNAYAKATRLEPDDPEGWNKLGHLQRRIGEFEAAHRSFERVLELGKQGDNQEWIAIATGNLGLVYCERGDLDRAEVMHKKSLAIDEALDRKEGMARYIPRFRSPLRSVPKTSLS